MKITESELIAYVDIDETLITSESIFETVIDPIKLDYYGSEWEIYPKFKNIEFIKSLKNRGYYIIVHSANGWLHAKKVVELLQLCDFVDEIKTKPLKYVDDKSVETWFGPRIYFEDSLFDITNKN